MNAQKLVLSLSVCLCFFALSERPSTCSGRPEALEGRSESKGGLYAFVAAQPAGKTAAEVQKQFVGHYRLLKFENFDEKGVARLAEYDGGRIMYDAAGNMSAQLMRSNRQPLSTPSTEPDRAAAYATYTAYYGKYTIDPSVGKVTHHVEGSMNQNWVKTDLVRWYAFSPDGNQLTLSIKNAEGRVTGTLTWERVK